MDEKTLTLCFTSDLHAHIYPTDYVSQSERDIGLFKCCNRFEKDGDTLVIDGGDLLQGSPLGAFCHDAAGDAGAFARIMNRCGYDYVTLGNHDFNFGMPYLDSYLSGLHARCLCENIVDMEGGVRFPACVHTLKNGLRVGLVGITTDYVNIWERPEHLAGVRVVRPVEAARRALERLRGKADLTVCVYHGGFERDLSTGRPLSQSTENMAYHICQELDFDILLTGHQHMSVPGQFLFGTYVAQPADSGREFIRIRAVVNGPEKSFFSETIPAGGACDPVLLADFSEMEQGAQTWLNQVVGRLSRPLQPEEPLHMASRGSALADFFNGVQLAASGAQLSATSLANGIAGLPQVVRRRDVLTAYPYTNTLAVLRITGAVLRQAMERSAEYFDLDAEGRLVVSRRFLQPKVEHYNYDYYAGVTYKIDVSRPLGQRVTELYRQGVPIMDGDEFTICLNSYRASGTGGYDCYLGCPVLREIGTEMADLMLDYFRQRPEIPVDGQAGFAVVGGAEKR